MIIELVVDGLNLLLDDGQDGANARLDPPGDGLRQAIALSGAEFDQLSSTGQKIGQCGTLSIVDRHEQNVFVNSGMGEECHAWASGGLRVC